MAKKKNHNKKSPSIRELVFKEDGQEYCKVTKMLGGARLQGLCSDGKERICKIRGAMSKRRKVWITAGDYVLVSLRDFQDDKADVIYRYHKEEVSALLKYGEIEPNDKEEDDNEDIGFDFEEQNDLELDIDNI